MERESPSEMENSWNALCFPWVRVMLQLRNEVGQINGMGCGHVALGEVGDREGSQAAVTGSY